MTLPTMTAARPKALLSEEVTVATETTDALSTERVVEELHGLGPWRLYVAVEGGDADCDADVVLRFRVSPDGGTTWFVDEDEVRVTLAGTAVVKVSLPIDLADVDRIALESIENEDDAGSATVMVWIARRGI